jgi:hypothetical protein
MEMLENGMWQMSWDQCRQRKMACQWDLVGITGPQDPNASKRAHKAIRKPVINVDNIEDAGDGTIPSPASDLTASVFAIWNVANALVMESASIQGVRGTPLDLSSFLFLTPFSLYSYSLILPVYIFTGS